MEKLTQFRWTTIGMTLLILSACGGGGSGNGGSTVFRIFLQQSSVNLTYREGSTSTSTVISATWQGDAPNPLYLGASIEGVGIQTPIPIVISPNTKSATATVTAASRAAGDYTGRIIFSACADPNCSQTVGGTPLPIPYEVKVSAPVFTVLGSTFPGAPVNFTHLLGTNVSNRSINISTGSGAWTATTSQPWLTISQASGSDAATITVSYNPALLTTGFMNGSVTVTSSVLGSQTLNVTAQLLLPTAQISGSFASFQGVAGGVLQQSQTANVTLSGGAVLPMTVTADQSWIQVSLAAPTAPGGFVVSVGPSAGSLRSGTYTGNVTVHLEGGVTDVETNFNVVLTLAKPVLTTSPSSIVLGGNIGRDMSAVPVTLSLNTNGNAYSWTVSSPPSWFSISQSSGTVNQNGSSVSLTPNRLQTSPGTIDSTLTFTTTINGEVISTALPVEFNLDTHKILASEPGVAFVDVPGTDRDYLSHTLNVRDNFGLNTNWTATDDAPWLSVTPYGADNSNLVLTVDSSALAVDRFYEATVRIHANDPTINSDDFVHVGLWVGSVMPTVSRFMPVGAEHGIGDPIRPYVYLHTNSETKIHVFNVYNAEEGTSVEGLPQDIQDLTISNDGQTLFALRNTQIIPIDLKTRAPGTPVDLPSIYEVRQQFNYIRPNGVGILLDNRGGAFLASTLAPTTGGIAVNLGVSGDQRYAFMGAQRWDIDFTAARNGDFVRTASGTVPGNYPFYGTINAANFDGSRSYMCGWVSSSGPNQLIVFDGRTMSAVVTLENPQLCTGLYVTRRGQAIFTRVQYGPDDITIYNPDSTVALTGLDLGDSSTNKISASGDGNFAIVQSRIIPIPR